MASPWTPRTIPSGGRVYVVGDIHGCIDELRTLLDFISANLSSADVMVFVGDYIDRGPASAQVVEHLLTFKKAFPSTVFLKGNHEAMLLEYLSGSRSIDHPYLKHGGKLTFNSYGASFADMLEAPASLIPAAHLNLIKALELGVLFEKYLIVHAGVEPGVPLPELNEDHLLWARDAFLNTDHTLSFTVVHGHTPFQSVSIRKNIRIGIDTGVVYGNTLTCLELPEGIAHYVQHGKNRVFTTRLPNFS